MAEEIHAYLANSLWVCIFLHVLGIAVMSYLHRENLVVGMVSGKKRAPDETVSD
jgi:cytochrome b